MGKFLKEKLFIFIVFFCVFFGIGVTNFLPQTSLTGWDDLHSEFNPLGNLVRTITSVWQEYEATGTFIGVNDASDFPRVLLLWIFSWILPTSIIRYVFHFLMLFVGTIGTYAAIKTFFIDREEKIGKYAALFGALFYLLNLGTMQYFSVPFEPFSAFWAMFPWLIFGTFRYLHNPTRKNLFIFALINFLAMPAFFLQTIFYIYLGIFLFLLIVNIVTQRTKNTIKTALLALLVFLCVNAFWLFPHLNWLMTNHSAVQQAASMNTLTTNQTLQTVQQFGNISDFMLFKNKPWDYRDFSVSNENFLLQPWHTYFNYPFIPAIGYVFFLIAVLGFVTNKQKRLFVVGLAIICFFILANQAPIAEQINALFRKIPLVNQVLRDPFTKFIVPAIFVFAIGFSGGIVLLYKLIPAKAVKPLSFVGTVVIGSLLIIYMLPAFTGHFIADRMRVQIPGYYFEFFEYMRQQDSTKRIADLPQGPIWGWMSYDWGYTGSGFLWHGVSQSILNRTFDVWNDKNEEYYWEITYALNKRDYVLFNAVLEKYDIAYLMFDSAMYFPDNTSSKFEIIRQKEFIDMNSALLKVRSFGSIDLYETQVKTNKYVSILHQPVSVLTDTNWLGEDKAYLDFGTYISDGNDNSQVTYPFRSLFSGRGTKDISYHVTATTGAFIFSADVPEGRLIFPQETEEEFIRFDGATLKQTKSVPQVINNESIISQTTNAVVSAGSLQVLMPNDNRYGSFDSKTSNVIGIGTEAVCDQKAANKKFSQSISEENEEQFVRFSSLNGRSCRVLSLSDIALRNGYLVAVKARHQKGDTLQFWVENVTAKRSSQQVFLSGKSEFEWEYFIIPPMAPDGVGYTLHFDNVSIGKQEAVNDLSRVIVYPLPYKFLTGMKVVAQDEPVRSVTNSEAVISVSHPSPSQYSLRLDPTKIQEGDVVSLSQTYDPGWKAYVGGIFGKPLKDHVVVNNWANGWVISESKEQRAKSKNNEIEIVIIFWPQWLQYLGFVLLPIPFIYALWPRKRVLP